MNHEDWLDVGRRQLALWPSQPWEPYTMAAAFELFTGIDAALAQKALLELSAEGREFAPPPGVVLARALQLRIASMPLLQDPDLTRPLTPEESDRARRMAAALTGDRARLVQVTWRLFSIHARVCNGQSEELRRCDQVADRCRRLTGVSGRYAPMWDELCSVGKPLFEAWRSAVDDLRLLRDDSVQQEAAL